MVFTFNPDFPEATNDQKWDQIRLWRNAELAKTDWAMISDAPTDKTAWAEYRQALRDLPAQGSSADDVEFPTKP